MACFRYINVNTLHKGENKDDNDDDDDDDDNTTNNNNNNNTLLYYSIKVNFAQPAIKKQNRHIQKIKGQGYETK
jgi:hypothetical protein